MLAEESSPENREREWRDHGKIREFPCLIPDGRVHICALGIQSESAGGVGLHDIRAKKAKLTTRDREFGRGEDWLLLMHRYPACMLTASAQMNLISHLRKRTACTRVRILDTMF